MASPIEIPAINLAAEPAVPPHPTYKVGVRRRTRQVTVGGIKVGGGAPISVQTMTKTKTGDVQATVAQIRQAAEAGCDIVRVTVNDKEAAEAIAPIVRQSPIPVVADIHFNHVFALKAIEASVAKVRLNPGNIGSRERIHQVLGAAKERGIPIRIGVNSGSLEEDILEKPLQRQDMDEEELMTKSIQREDVEEDISFTGFKTDSFFYGSHCILSFALVFSNSSHH